MFVLSIFQVTKNWEYEEVLADLNQSIRKAIKRESLIEEIQLSINDSKFDEARIFIAIAKASKLFNDSSSYTLIDLKKLELEIKQKDTVLRQIVSQTSSFANGFIQGKSPSAAGIAGSVVADFTVIGDIRDLKKEYDNYEKGQDVNELIVGLSGAGIGLTALTLSTKGLVAPVKTGISVMKVAAKTQRISRSFQRYLVKLGRDVFDWPLFSRGIKNNKSLSNIRKFASQAYNPNAIQPLEKIAKRVNVIRKSTSTMDAVNLLKYIDTPKDLIQLEKISLKYGTKTKGMMKLLGKSALRTVRVLQKTLILMLSLLSGLLSGLFSLFLLFSRKI